MRMVDFGLRLCGGLGALIDTVAIFVAGIFRRRTWERNFQGWGSADAHRLYPTFSFDFALPIRHQSSERNLLELIKSIR